MTIKYKPKRLRINLILGLFWLTFSIITYFIEDNLSWIDYSWFFLGLAYFAFYFYQKSQQYLTLENGILKKIGFLGKRL